VKKRKLGIFSLAIGVFALALVGCGGNKQESSGGPAPAASAPAGKTVDAATAGEVSGSVKLDGTPPKMKTISMAAEPACTKGHTGPVTSEEVVTGAGGALANVVVYVKSGLDGRSVRTSRSSTATKPRITFTPSPRKIASGMNRSRPGQPPSTSLSRAKKSRSR
jgi:hypothetical protein